MATIMRAAAARVRAAAKGLDAWLERRRLAAPAYREFATMSERQLRDIGLSRADVHLMTWGSSDRDSNPV